MKKYKLWKILTIVFAFLTVVLIVANVIANMYATTLNWVLGTSSTEVVKDENAGPGPIYYESEFAKKNASGESERDKDGKEVIDTEALAKAGDDLVQEVTSEGIVLLMNDGALPLEKGSTVSLFGQAVDDPVTSGTGSGATGASDATYVTSLELGGLKVNEASWNFYSKGAGASYKQTMPSMHSTDPFVINECPWSKVTSDSTYAQMIDTDTALVAFIRNGGEGFDLTSGASTVGKDNSPINVGDGLTKEEGSLSGNNYLELNSEERDLLKGLTDLKENKTIKNIVVVLNSPNAMELDFLADEDIDVDACLWMGPTGQSGLNALGKLLSGETTPSGKLIDTYAYDNLREPSVYNYGHNIYTNFDSKYASQSAAQDSQAHLNQKYYEVYREGIYVGYRYYETRYEDYVLGNTDNYNYDEIVAYSFGHGLSYATFEYSNFTVTESEDGKSLTAKVTVKNTSDKYSGKEVVELYAQTPYTDYDKENGIEKASVELVGYDKTALLAPGASEEVTITVSKEVLAAYDANKAKTYIMDAGDYYLTFGNGAHDALNAIINEKAETEDVTVNADRIVIASDPVKYDDTDSRVYHWTVSQLDTTTYSKSSVTGADITNQFDFADINKYTGNGGQSVKYVTRSDWNGSFDISTLESMQATSVKLEMTDEMFAELTNDWYEPAADANTYEMPTMGADNGLTLAMFVGVGLDEKAVIEDAEGNKHEYSWDDLLDQMTYAEMLELIVNGQHQTAAVKSVGKPETKDENGPSGFNITFAVAGGTASGTAYCAPCVRAATWNDELVERVGELIGEDGLAAGKNGIYGPAANTHRNAYGGRNFEYYSEDPFVSSAIGAAECKGIQSKGIIVYEKHFALNDSETHREGLGVWSNEQATREIYLEAFRGIMSSNGGNAHAAMSGFNRLGTKWCGNSSELMNNVLRGEWGFDGFVATDMDNCNSNILCTGYMYAPAAVTGGTDIYDGAGNPANHNRKNQMNAYRNDAYVVSHMRTAAERILYTVANSAAMNGLSANDTIRNVTPWWQAALIAATVVFGVLALGSVAMWVLNAKGILQFPKPRQAKAEEPEAENKEEQ